jgi:hypothetical protein
MRNKGDRGENGLGHIYLRGNTYWIKYHKDGKPFYESSGSHFKKVAIDLLKKRVSNPVQVKAGPIMIGALLDDYRAYSEVHNPKSYETFGRQRAGALRPFWGTGRWIPSLSDRLTVR